MLASLLDLYSRLIPDRYDSAVLLLILVLGGGCAVAKVLILGPICECAP